MVASVMLRLQALVIRVDACPSSFIVTTKRSQYVLLEHYSFQPSLVFAVPAFGIVVRVNRHRLRHAARRRLEWRQRAEQRAPSVVC